MKVGKIAEHFEHNGKQSFTEKKLNKITINNIIKYIKPHYNSSCIKKNSV